MDPIKELLEECKRRNWVPEHKCHFSDCRTYKIRVGKSVQIKREFKCAICGKISDKPTELGKLMYKCGKGFYRVKE